MSDAYRTNPTTLIVTFIAGALTGAVVALLTAPRSGRETRDRVRTLAQDLAGGTGRFPAALNDAYARAAQAARQAFVQSLDAGTIERAAGSDRGDH